MHIDTESLEQTLAAAKEQLIAARAPAGYWQGKLSSSALATATAVFALSMVDRQKYESLIGAGLDWLSDNCNADGGWPDTVLSVSNIPATMLCWAAFTAAQDSHRYDKTIADAESWLVNHVGALKPESLVKAVNQQYGNDRTFSAPILTMCALAGRLGDSKQAWAQIKALPFELAACPHQLFKWLRLPVVSYALPALISVGRVNYHHRRPANPVTRLLRHFTQRRTLEVLQDIQPENGGFLEAVPLTSFVVMSLVAAGQKDNAVVSRGIEFLLASVRDDGSWPIDTNLATWVTTLSVNALVAGSDFKNVLSLGDRTSIQQWLLSQQHRKQHPYTHAPAGGWAWTDLPGGVPDADDTAGALIALYNLNLIDDYVIDAAVAGVKWLLGLQNRDGGIPTFCRGWMDLPFDRSSPDLTAHAITAMAAWQDRLPNSLTKQAERAIVRGIEYLARAQNSDGSWIPLWFGNESAPKQENPVYGTSRVLTGLCWLPWRFISVPVPMLHKGAEWLLSLQNVDGGWGGAKSVSSSVEETALAVDALAGLLKTADANKELQLPTQTIESAIRRGAAWLVEKTDRGKSMPPVPIGLYFATLWYFEKLYPLIFTISALNKVRRFCHKGIAEKFLAHPGNG